MGDGELVEEGVGEPVPVLLGVADELSVGDALSLASCSASAVRIAVRLADGRAASAGAASTPT